MNPNEILAQQQAYLNQVVQHNQQIVWGYLAIQVALFIFGIWVIYMFYARLRDIAEELKKLRIAFEFAEDRKARTNVVSTHPKNSGGDNPFAADDRYQPKAK